MESLPNEIQEEIKAILDAESEISISKPEKYNDFVHNSENVTSVSASGRTMKGEKEVKDATIMVSHGNKGERDRFVDWISCDYVNGMAYAVFKTGVTIDKEDGSSDELCWVVTLIVKETESGWKLVHRHNTRSKK